MKTLAAVAALFVLIAFIAKRLLGLWFAGAVARELQRAAAEREILEPADWIGTTGLDEDTERELPRYLRRELGERLGADGALRAADLRYLGVASDDRGAAHFWHMPERGEGPVFAYVDIAFDGQALGLGWGDRAFPAAPQAQETA